MKFIFPLAIAMLFSVAGLAQPASAQQNMPGGGWDITCRNAQMHGSVLRAQCRRMDDSWMRSSLDVSQCRNGLVANVNGSLACEGRVNGQYGPNAYSPNAPYGPNGYNARNNGLPGGGWSDTCRNASMRGNMLSASCQDERGNYQYSSIDVTQCRQNLVANVNGYLACRQDQR